MLDPWHHLIFLHFGIILMYYIFAPATIQDVLLTWGEAVLSDCVGSDPKNTTLAHSYSHVNLGSLNSKCQNWPKKGTLSYLNAFQLLEMKKKVEFLDPECREKAVLHTRIMH